MSAPPDGRPPDGRPPDSRPPDSRPPDGRTGLERLEAVLRELEDVIVAFSGGADSAFLAAVAHRTLGSSHVMCVTAVSDSLSEDDRAHCRALAAQWGLRWTTVDTGEMADPEYVRNDGNRCARCKDALMARLVPLAAEHRATVVLGVNVDDLGDHRPGQAAAAAAGARFPLVDAGLTKADVRAWSKELGLRTWDRPAGACLASRLPYGTPVTAPRLRAVADAEAAIRGLGFRQFRVRHHEAVARVEIADAEIEEAVHRRHEVVAAVKAAGYTFVALDLEGFRSGSMNRLLVSAAPEDRAPPAPAPAPAPHA